MVAIKTTFITDVQPLTISGRLSNYTWILERIWIMATNHTQKTFKNRIPGIRQYKDRYTHKWVQWRRFNDNDEIDYSQEGLNIDDIHVFGIKNGQLKEIKLKNKTDNKYSVEKLIEQSEDEYEKSDRDESQSQTSENYYDNSIESIMNTDDKLAKRRSHAAGKWSDSDVLELQQKKKRKELLKFMEGNYQTTNYFYHEMKRIIHDRVTIDDLRLMVSELEKKGNEKFKVLMLRYYNKLYKAKEKRLYEADFWKARPNNLVIRQVSNPFENGE